MILPISPRFVHNRGHGFSKRLNPAGVYCFYHWYRPTPCLCNLALFLGKPAGRARLNLYKAWDYPRVIVTTGQVSTPCPIATPIITIIIIIIIFLFHHQSHTRKWKAQTRGPLDTPALIIRLKGVPYAPTFGSTLVLVQEVKNSQPRRQEWGKTSTTLLTTHPSLLAN